MSPTITNKNNKTGSSKWMLVSTPSRSGLLGIDVYRGPGPPQWGTQPTASNSPKFAIIHILNTFMIYPSISGSTSPSSTHLLILATICSWFLIRRPQVSDAQMSGSASGVVSLRQVFHINHIKRQGTVMHRKAYLMRKQNFRENCLQHNSTHGPSPWL